MKVALVGAGPGDPGLLTLRGKELLGLADVVVYDALANPAFLEGTRPEAELIYVGKIADRHALPQGEINSLLAAKAREGKLVVRLKGGDPYIFGRGGEEGEYLAQRNIPFEVVPGISSAIAGPAYAGISLTHRGYVSSLCILTGHENPEKGDSSHNWPALAQSGSTLVFVMGMKNLAQISSKLITGGLPPDTPAALIYRATTPAQRSLFSTLGEIPAQARAQGFTNPSVLVVGRVVELHETLDWFGHKPLLGKKIIVTRARAQASELAASLASLGAEVLQCPTIEITPLADANAALEAMGKLPSYDWVVFTSANGVDKFMDLLWRSEQDSRAFGHAKIAVIGPATENALRKYGLRADLVPPGFVAESLGEALRQNSLQGKRILIARARQARDTLPELLREAGALTEVVPVYETVMSQASEEARRQLLGGEIDCVTFTSSSTVRNFFQQFPDLAQLPILASIGPVTSGTLADLGYSADLQADTYTIPGLVKALCDYFAGQGKCGE